MKRTLTTSFCCSTRCSAFSVGSVSPCFPLDAFADYSHQLDEFLSLFDLWYAPSDFSESQHFAASDKNAVILHCHQTHFRTEPLLFRRHGDDADPLHALRHQAGRVHCKQSSRTRAVHPSPLAPQSPSPVLLGRGERQDDDREPPRAAEDHRVHAQPRPPAHASQQPPLLLPARLAPREAAEHRGVHGSVLRRPPLRGLCLPRLLHLPDSVEGVPART